MIYLTRILSILVISILVQPARAQVSDNPDNLFARAKKAAFDEKDYQQGIRLSKQALSINPDYLDIRIFLGRLYTYAEFPDSARIEFKRALELKPGYEDTYVAYGSLEYWTNHPDQALNLVNEGIRSNENSETLWLLKGRILTGLRRFKDANSSFERVLELNPGNTDARALYGSLINYVSNNKIGLNYDYVYFDKQFDSPWHLASVEYLRQTGIGPLILRGSIANRFSNSGTQIELDAYPRLSRTFYTYISGGYSGSAGVFPKYRAGFSLFASLPAAFEAEGGVRMLNFGQPTWVFTGALSKYYKSFLFSFRSILAPVNNSTSHAISFNTRYYLGGADDYLSFGLGTGLSPDNPRNNILFNSGQSYNLKSNNISAGYQRSFKKVNIVALRASLANQEYQKNVRGNQLEMGLSYFRRF